MKVESFFNLVSAFAEFSNNILKKEKLKYTLYIKHFRLTSNLSLYLLYYAEACNEFAGPISTSLRLSNTAPFKEMSQWWRAVGNTVPYLTVPRFESQASCSRYQRVTARLTSQ